MFTESFNAIFHQHSPSPGTNISSLLFSVGQSPACVIWLATSQIRVKQLHSASSMETSVFFFLSLSLSLSFCKRLYLRLRSGTQLVLMKEWSCDNTHNFGCWHLELIGQEAVVAVTLYIFSRVYFNFFCVRDYYCALVLLFPQILWVLLPSVVDHMYGSQGEVMGVTFLQAIWGSREHFHCTMLVFMLILLAGTSLWGPAARIYRLFSLDTSPCLACTPRRLVYIAAPVQLHFPEIS